MTRPLDTAGEAARLALPLLCQAARDLIESFAAWKDGEPVEGSASRNEPDLHDVLQDHLKAIRSCIGVVGSEDFFAELPHWFREIVAGRRRP